MVGYRIPSASEFVQGFEFQYRQKFGGGSANYIDEHGVWHQVAKFKTYSKWLDMKVWWMPRTREEATIVHKWDDGSTCTTFINPVWDCPFNVEERIKFKTVRVKL